MQNHKPLVLMCAGKSERYGRPKHLLTHPSGNLMCGEALLGLSEHFTEVIIALRNLADHQIIKNEFEFSNWRVNICVVGETLSPLETAYETVKLMGIKGGAYFKDCDNHFFIPELTHGPSHAYTIDPKTVEGPLRLDNKSFHKDSGNFHCGLYYLDDVSKINFQKHSNFHEIIDNQKLIDGQSYCDWGTLEDWKRFVNRYRTVFLDIDGIICENGSRSLGRRWGSTRVFPDVVKMINKAYKSGTCYIILCTSRDWSYMRETAEQLRGLNYHRLLMGLPACKRVLINDRNSMGDTALAYNFERDRPNLNLLADALYGGTKNEI